MIDGIDPVLLDPVIDLAIKEDIGSGDHTSQACLTEAVNGYAELLVKEPGIISGIALAKYIFQKIDSVLIMETWIHDGSEVQVGDIVFGVRGRGLSILKSERIVLNFMQRMSGIATKTQKLTQLVKDYPVKILDTRKTAPGLRLIEKWAVRTGGGHNHRMGLYDMIMIKDNHIDFCGGIGKAILNTVEYLKKNRLPLKIEIETRNLIEVQEVLDTGMVDIIMLDNFTPADIDQALKMINGKCQTEASGNIGADNILDYAATGVDFISSGSITHSYNSLDLSLKAKFS